jgi:hypothetical protein
MFMSCEQNSEASYIIKRANEFFEKWQGANVGNDSSKSNFMCKEIRAN